MCQGSEHLLHHRKAQVLAPSLSVGGRGRPAGVAARSPVKAPQLADSGDTTWVSACHPGAPRQQQREGEETQRRKPERERESAADMDLRSELLKSIWYGFTALDLEKSGKVSKSQLKVSAGSPPPTSSWTLFQNPLDFSSPAPRSPTLDSRSITWASHQRKMRWNYLKPS